MDPLLENPGMKPFETSFFMLPLKDCTPTSAGSVSLVWKRTKAVVVHCHSYGQKGDREGKSGSSLCAAPVSQSAISYSFYVT